MVVEIAGGKKVRGIENMVLRRIFGFRRDEVWAWRRLHNEELNDLYTESKKIQRPKIF